MVLVTSAVCDSIILFNCSFNSKILSDDDEKLLPRIGKGTGGYVIASVFMSIYIVHVY